MPWGHLSSSELAHTLTLECASLNKPAFPFLWLAVEFLPARSQGPSLGSLSQGLTRDLGHDHPLGPHFFSCNIFSGDQEGTALVTMEGTSKGVISVCLLGCGSPLWRVAGTRPQPCSAFI